MTMRKKQANIMLLLLSTIIYIVTIAHTFSYI